MTSRLAQTPRPVPRARGSQWCERRGCPRGRSADRPQAVPAPRRRARESDVLAHSRVRLEPGQGRAAIRVPALHERDVPRERRHLLGHEPDEPSRLPSTHAALDHRLPARALRTRSRRARRHDDGLERTLRLRHGARGRPYAAPVISRPPPLDAGRRRRRVPGLVRRSAEDGADADERRRSAGVLLVPPGGVLAGPGALADPGAERRLQRPRKRLAGGGIRPLEPGLQLCQPAVCHRSAEAGGDGLRRGHQRRRVRTGPQIDPCLCLRRQPAVARVRR